ncbi:MAG TPA: aminotransferase class V-fold PLP-dependent enzyme [Labilithrix sp.]|nr:aminotransferase class V-fold PLP-dependent enzyme [Labilithrix sp.]
MITKLLNPGPVSMTERVRAALASEDVCHREPEFKELVGRVRERITGVYDEAKAGGYVPVLLGGSGTCAVETMLSLVAKDETSLVVANGVYGERIAAMLKAQGKACEVIASAWTDGIDLVAADEALSRGPREGQKAFGHVLTVHHETTTGRLNDVAGLGMLAQKHGVPMLLDAVSSFAGEDLQLGEWNIEALAATANKCVHGAPGVSFVLTRESALKRPSGATSVYLDLSRHAADQAKGSTPFTLPTHVTRAFDEALAELADEGGWTKRHSTYQARSSRVRSVCRELSAPLLLDREDAYSSILTSFRLPAGRTYENLHAALRGDGFVIYAGQGKFDGAIFRIAVMGDLSSSDLDRLAASLRRALA